MFTHNKYLHGFGSGIITTAGDLILWVLLLITVIAKFVPLSPVMPADGLDPSWKFGMNQAVAQGLSFGKEIIFTFGPYASIYTREYHPATDFIMVSGSLYLALSYWVCLVLLIKGAQWRWGLAFFALLAGTVFLPDALFFSFPLLVGLTTFKNVFSDNGLLTKSKYAPFYVVLLFAPFGLLPLVKGTFLILCCAITALCSVFFIIGKHRVLAIISLTSPVVSMLLFWIASGQSVIDLPYYFMSMTPIVFGYSEAMGFKGNTLEIILYLVASAFLLLSIFLEKQMTGPSKFFLMCILFVFLFLSFKSGFVRHDGHATISGTAILFAALMLPFIFKPRILLVVIVLSLISWSYIDGHYFKTSTENIPKNIASTYLSPWKGLKNRIKDRNWPRREFDAAVNAVRERASFPILQGSTDIYSYNQSYLISSGNTWSPRPILQSYSAYTPWLLEVDRKHLLGAQAPDNVIFRVEPIDERVPAMEDGVSWPILMVNYQPTRIANDFLFLRKKEVIGEITEPLILTSETHAFGDTVDIPPSGQPIFAQIEIKPTFWGRIASILFKPRQLEITIELKNGTKKQYRVIAGMAKSGFLISPLIENTLEFGMLYGKKDYLNGKLVKSFVIAPSHGKTRQWKNKYNVTLSQIRTASPVDLSNIYKSGFDLEVSCSKMTSAEKCDGNIDMVNGSSLASKRVFASGVLRVDGWLATSVDKATLPEAVYAILTDNHGNRSCFRTRRTPRPDVGEHFKNPKLNDSGFSASADISELDGHYTLGLAFKQSNKMELCPQFNFPITITK